MQPHRPIVRVGRLPRSIALLTLAFVSLGAVPALAGDLDGYFSPNGGGMDAIAAEIDAARGTIDVGMYHVYTEPGSGVFEALRRAVRRGVKVRMVMDHASDANREDADALEAIGVDVRAVPATMHNKFAIFDGKTVANGSANWSYGAEYRYSDNTTFFRDRPGLAGQFAAEFNRLLADSKDVPGPASKGDVSPSKAREPRADEGLNVWFTSANQGTNQGTGVVAEQLIQAMQGAKTSIDVALPWFNSEPLADALIAMHEARNKNADPSDDVEIRVLLDMGEYSSKRSQARALEKAGIPVRYKFFSMQYYHPRTQLMHHKYMIVDGERLLSGSYNWSDTAEFVNWDNVVDVRGPKNRELVASYTGEVDRLWNQGREKYPAFRRRILAKKGDPDYSRIIPIHFDTPYFNGSMTLTRSEIKPVRGQAFAAGVFTWPQASYLDRETKMPLYSEPTGTFLGPTRGILATMEDVAQ